MKEKEKFLNFLVNNFDKYTWKQDFNAYAINIREYKVELIESGRDNIKYLTVTTPTNKIGHTLCSKDFAVVNDIYNNVKNFYNESAETRFFSELNKILNVQ